MLDQTQKLIVKSQSLVLAEDEKLLLDSGESFGPVTVAYETYGKLNEDKSNAILICHALSGDAHVAGYYHADDSKPGWWDAMVGPGKSIDTNRFFVVASNVIGGCYGTTGPSSINPKTGQPFGIDFPVITIGDMVKVQKRLIETFGIEKLVSVIGGSMGGMQALDWSIRYPEAVSSAVVIAATAKSSAQSIGFQAVGRNAILKDPNWQNGNYYGKSIPAQGLAIARMIAHITYLSDESMSRKFGRRLQTRKDFGFDFESEFEVESYLDYQGNKFVERFDANSYLYVTKAIDYFDVTKQAPDGRLETAFAPIQAKILVISFSSDWLFPPSQSREMVEALNKAGKEVTYMNIDASYGHDSFLIEKDIQGRLIQNFISSIRRNQK